MSVRSVKYWTRTIYSERETPGQPSSTYAFIWMQKTFTLYRTFFLLNFLSQYTVIILEYHRSLNTLLLKRNMAVSEAVIHKSVWSY